MSKSEWVTRIGCLLCILATSCTQWSPPYPPASASHPETIEASVFLIGDAGDPGLPDPVLRALTSQIEDTEDSITTTVVFLGDNIYPRGLPDVGSPGRAESEHRLDAQVAAANAAQAVYFVPGNHDWADATDDGWNAIRRQGRYLSVSGVASLLPADGCPGPAIVDPGPTLRLIFLDTQWWLHDGPRPGSDSACPFATPDSVVTAIATAIREADGRHVIVTGHHPLRSSGPHAARFGWIDHIFPLRAAAGWAWIPLPVLGSLYPLSRMWGITPQDMTSARNRAFQAAIRRAFDDDPPLAYAAGHEHALEVHRGPGAEYTLVSGAGSFGQVSSLRPRAETIFATAANGFMRIDAYRGGRVLLRVIAVDPAGEPSTVWVQSLR